MIKIAFLGDISLNNKYIDYSNNNIQPFKGIIPLLNEQHYVIGNLESIAKGELGENVLKKPRLTTTVKTLKYLRDINLSISALANNHVYDHLEDGFIKTTDFLNRNNIRHIGAGLTKKEANKELIISENGIHIGILNYVTNDTNPSMPDDSNVYLNLFDIERTIKDMEGLSGRVHHIVIFIHWGGRVEGGGYPDLNQPLIGRKLIDAGADLIVGHHSHTLQPYEIYNGKYIFYSLGNFCFSDIYFNNSIYKKLNSSNRKSAILLVNFKLDSYSCKYEYINNNNGFINIKNNYKHKFLFHVISKILLKIFKYKIIWNLYFLKIKIINPIIYYIIYNDDKLIKKIRNIKINKIFNLIKLNN
ncbi:MAG: CapA family protein [Cyclobacteriaceae bacterium]